MVGGKEFQLKKLYILLQKYFPSYSIGPEQAPGSDEQLEGRPLVLTERPLKKSTDTLVQSAAEGNAVTGRLSVQK